MNHRRWKVAPLLASAMSAVILVAVAPHSRADEPHMVTQAELDKTHQAIRQARRIRAEGKLDEAVKAGEDAEALVRSTVGENNEAEVLTVLFLAEVHARRGDVAATREASRRALTLLSRLNDLPRWRGAEIRWALSAAEAVAQRDADLRRRYGEIETQEPELKSMQLYYAGRYREAIELARRTEEVYRAALGARHPERARTLSSLAEFLRMQGDEVRARELIEEAGSILKQADGEAHPYYAAVLSNRALILESQGNGAEARPLLLRALAILRETWGERHEWAITCMSNLASHLEQAGSLARAWNPADQAAAADLAQAKALMERVVVLRREIAGPKSRAYATALDKLATFLSNRGDYDGALARFDEAQAVYRSVVGKRHLDYAVSLSNKASLYQKKRKLADALALVEEALDITKEVLGDQHLQYVEGLYGLVALRLETGDRAGAIRALDQAGMIYDALLTRTLPSLTEREQVALLGNAPIRLWLDLSLSAGDRGRDEEMYRRVLASKAVAAEAATQRRVAASPAAVGELTARVRSLRARLGQLHYARIPAELAETHQKDLRTVADDLAARESELARAVGWSPAVVRPQQVADALPEGVALIDFVHYLRSEAVLEGAGTGPVEWRYAAFITRRGRKPQRIDIPAAELSITHNFRETSSGRAWSPVFRYDRRQRSGSRLLKTEELPWMITPCGPRVCPRRHSCPTAASTPVWGPSWKISPIAPPTPSPRPPGIGGKPRGPTASWPTGA